MVQAAKAANEGEAMGQPVTVICSYRPHEGQSEALLELVAGHVPLLRRRSYLSDATTCVLQGKSEVVEIFEWVSEARARAAHTDPVIQAYWARMAEISTFVPLNTLPEASEPFAHFRRIS